MRDQQTEREDDAYAPITASSSASKAPSTHAHVPPQRAAHAPMHHQQTHQSQASRHEQQPPQPPQPPWPSAAAAQAMYEQQQQQQRGREGSTGRGKDGLTEQLSSNGCATESTTAVATESAPRRKPRAANIAALRSSSS